MSAAIVLVLTALPASAAPQEELDPPRAPLEPEATVDAILPAPKPYNCYGYTDDPHVSRHEPGYAITLVRTECKIQASSQYAYGEMWRDRWYGLEFLDSHSSTYFYAYGKVRAIPKWYCRGVGTYTYRTWGRHTATIGGTVYGASTYNDRRFAC